MRSLVETCIRRPVFATMLIATLVVVGVASFLHLGVDRFPSVDLPTVSVRTTLPGASTEDVETLVSQRIEEAVNTIEGIDQLRSISTNGSSVVVITFALERNIEAATQDVRDRVATVLRDLPPEAEAPIISKFDNDQTPALTLAVSSERPLRELTEIADKLVKPHLERCTGVGRSCSSAPCRARSTCRSTATGSRRTDFRSPTCATRSSGRTRRRRAAT